MVSRNRKIARRIGQAVANDVLDISGAISAGAGVTVYATADDLPTTGLTAGDEAFVSGSNRLYISNGTGWYSIGLVNTNPAITSVEDPSNNTTPFTLATDGSALVLTITAADPEDIPLTYNYAVTTGSLTNGGGTTATVVQGTGASTNQFTITPTTTEAYAGTFELTFTTSDGINQASSVNSFTLNFITYVTNSRYTTLLATATSNKPYSAPSASNQVSSISIGAQTASPTEVVFGDSGTKMFVLSSNRYVYSYSVSTAYDASTASYVATSSELTELSTDTSQSFRFKPDGTVMFVSSSGGYVYQYSLSTAWDVSTISYASKFARHANSTHSYTALTFKPDGTRMYMAGLRYVMSMTLSTPWDLGSTTSDNSGTGFTNAYLNLSWVYGHTITGMDFNSTGTSLTMVYGNNASDKYIIEHPIDSAWNVSNATVLGAAPSIKYQQNSIQGLSYANNGNTLISVLDTGDTVYTYDTSFNGVNNNITDTSSNNHSITVTGDAHAGTFSPYRSGGYSLKFNGTANNYIRAPYWQRANLGTNDFTVECFVYPTNNFSVICDLLPGSAGLFRLATWTGGNLRLDINKQGVGAFDIRTTGGNINYNAWNHVAVCRSGTSLKLYSNGSLIHTETGGDWDYGTGDAYSNIGRWNTTGDVLNGYISNFRVKNSALYTGNTYTVPTEGFTSDAGTTLLVGAGALIDNVTPYGVEMYGVVTSEPFSPYDYNEYDAADHGGSVYFDRASYNSGGCITVADHNDFTLGTSDWTVKFWVYHNEIITSANNAYGYFSNYYFNTPGGFGLKWMNQHGNKPVLEYMNSGSYAKKIFDFIPSEKIWYYYELTCSSSTVTFKVNGDTIGTQSMPDLGNPNRTLIVGAASNGSSGVENFLGGYIADFQYVIGGTASESSVPTALMSTDSNSTLHIKGTDASIIDKSQINHLKIHGNTTGSTTQVKFANTKSVYFDGSSDYISAPTNKLFGFSTNDFTVEFWVYFNDVNNAISIYSNLSSVSGLQPHIYVYQNAIRYYTAAGDRIVSSSVSTGQWYHVALSRSSSSTKLFINGTQSGSTYSDSNDYGLSQPLGIGTYWDSGSPVTSQTLNGYMQDLRVTKGLARYTTSFTPPTASLEG
jgi:hypothetical protein